MDWTPATEAEGLGSILGKCRIFIQNRTFSQRKCGLLDLYLKLVTFSTFKLIFSLGISVTGWPSLGVCLLLNSWTNQKMLL